MNLKGQKVWVLSTNACLGVSDPADWEPPWHSMVFATKESMFAEFDRIKSVDPTARIVGGEDEIY